MYISNTQVQLPQPKSIMTHDHNNHQTIILRSIFSLKNSTSHWLPRHRCSVALQSLGVFQGFGTWWPLMTVDHVKLMTRSTLGAKSRCKFLPWVWLPLRHRWGEPDVNQWVRGILQEKNSTLVLWCVSGKKTLADVACVIAIVSNCRVQVL